MPCLTLGESILPPKLLSPSFVAPSEGRISQPSFMVLLEEEEKVHSVEYKDRHRGSYIYLQQQGR